MFAIYIPGCQSEANAALRSVGAEWALDASVTAMGQAVIDGGPDGGHGLLVYFDRRGRFAPNALATIDLAAQQWEPAAPDGDLVKGRYWLGVWRQQRPGPEDLLRACVADGIQLELRDGHQWIVPIADYLPQMLRLNRETGEEELRPSDRDRAFIAQANRIFRLLISDEFQQQVAEEHIVNIPGGLRFASDALAKNYRVNLDLLELMSEDGLVGQWEAVKIAMIATGLEPIRASDKKKEIDLLGMRSCDF